MAGHFKWLSGGGPMQIPEYVTKQEVKRVSQELGLRDWSRMKKHSVSDKEAAIVRKAVGGEALQVPIDVFRTGLEVELEHGVVYPDSNVTNNHPLLTGKIVVAHLKEMLDYYERLEVAEIEGDIYKAVQKKDAAKIARYTKKLALARQKLAAVEAAGLK
jgi:hypothetical protein